MASAPSVWASAKFGVRATAAAEAIVDGLWAGHARALGSHEASRLATADGYGAVLWLAVAEEIGRRLAPIEGAQRVRPDRARYSLGMVNNNIVFPQRIATDLRTPPDEARLRMSGVRADLFSLAPAPPPSPEMLPLWDETQVADQKENVSLNSIEDIREAGLVLVAYVSSPDGGLLRAWWGEASLAADGRMARLEWRYREQLDLTQDSAQARRTHLTLVRDQAPGRRFDSAQLEETPLDIRNPLEPVTTEPARPATPTGSGDDES
jgi:hypothetical protein